MSTIIGHSSIDENGKASGGQAGDQTGKEVCTRSWYSKNWSYVLRPLDKNVAEKMAVSCEKGCANPALGYDQGQRNTLKTQAVACGMDLSKITVPCECDCSSFMTVCAECAGIPIAYNNGNAPTTSTMKSAFMNTGSFELLSDEKYLTSDKYLKRGDILVAVGSHTVMVLSNGELADISQKQDQQDKNRIKAIDLSKYNTVTNYITLAKDIKYAIIRVGYRSSSNGVLTVDDLFNRHIENCIANGLQVGIYFYDQSINVAEAKEQAEWVINMIKPYTISLPIYIDSEAMPNHTGRADNISKEQRTKNVIAFCNRILELGYTTGIYASDSWFKSMLDYDKIKDYHIWCARYSVNKPTISHYDIWQYGSEQFVWALKPIDVNWIYKLPTNTQKPKNEPNTGEIKGNDKKTSYDYEISNIVKVSDYLNIRLQPISFSPVVGKLYNNNKIEIHGYVKDWYMISTKMDKWVSDKYITTKTGKTTANLNYRENVGSNSAVLGMYEKGTTIKLLNKKLFQNEYWYLCVDDKERFGWCSGKYISV